jgi:hypothetical protein
VVPKCPDGKGALNNDCRDSVLANIRRQKERGDPVEVLCGSEKLIEFFHVRFCRAFSIENKEKDGSPSTLYTRPPKGERR